MTQPEGLIKSAIMDYLRVLPGCYARSVQVGIIPGRTNHSKGISDIIAVYRGRFLAIEVKTEKKTSKASPEQLKFLECINKCGGVGIIARSVDDVITAVKSMEAM